MSKCTTKVIAHRGFSGKYPENTMLAFEQAVRAGADCIELDVRLSGDGQPVIIHDQTLERTAKGGGAVGGHGAALLAELGVPTLRQYLDFAVKLGVSTNIELKTDAIAPGLVEAVAALVEEYAVADRVIVSSFDHAAVREFARLCDGAAAAYIYKRGAWGRVPGGMIEQAAAEGMAYIHPHYSMINSRFVRDAHAAGLRVNAWTVNSAAVMRYLLRMGIDGIVTDHPDVLQYYKSLL